MAQLTSLHRTENALALVSELRTQFRDQFNPTTTDEHNDLVTAALADMVLKLADESPHTRNDYRQLVADYIDDHAAREGGAK